MLSSKFCKIFKNSFFAEYLWATASDFPVKPMQPYKAQSLLHAFHASPGRYLQWSRAGGPQSPLETLTRKFKYRQ